jgi:hypothetical protein
MVHGQNRWADTVYDTRPSDSSFGVDPGERIGAAVPRPAATWIALRFALAVALSGAWTAAVTTADIKRVLSMAEPAVAAVIETARNFAAAIGAAGPQPTVVESPADTAVQRLPSVADSALPPLVADVPQPEDPNAPAGPEAVAPEAIGTDYTEKAEEAEEPAAKKEQRKHAASAGLGPDLPNVLLSRLSKEDFKNAAYAIKTAIAKTADDAKFVWPLAPSPQQAKFEVHFVTGAGPGCRRYVVTVTKDRWSSTSAALERCGASLARAS